jgi:hypothetical protein
MTGGAARRRGQVAMRMAAFDSAQAPTVWWLSGVEARGGEARFPMRAKGRADPAPTLTNPFPVIADLTRNDDNGRSNGRMGTEKASGVVTGRPFMG